MSAFIKNLYGKGFLHKKEHEGKVIYHIQTPCRFVLKEAVVSDLKRNYLTDEEIGGILWAEPQLKKDEKVFVINKVDYIRNDIEDESFYDKNGKLRTCKDTYRPDKYQHAEVIKKIFAEEHLPVKFHTHPTKGSNFLESLTIQNLMTNTSEQDRIESEQMQNVDGIYLLMPRALIVGNNELASNIFIGLYNGFVAPIEFDEAKRLVQEKNMRRISESLSSMTYSEGEKLGLMIGAVLLIFAIAKYPKYSVPVLLGLGGLALLHLDNTNSINNPKYFNKLSFGPADIYLP